MYWRNAGRREEGQVSWEKKPQVRDMEEHIKSISPEKCFRERRRRKERARNLFFATSQREFGGYVYKSFRELFIYVYYVVAYSLDVRELDTIFILCMYVCF